MTLLLGMRPPLLLQRYPAVRFTSVHRGGSDFTVHRIHHFVHRRSGNPGIASLRYFANVLGATDQSLTRWTPAQAWGANKELYTGRHMLSAGPKGAGRHAGRKVPASTYRLKTK